MCAGAWIPFGMLPDFGLLAALREQDIPVICPPSTVLATILETLGLDYRLIKPLNIVLLNEAFETPSDFAGSGGTPSGLTDCIDPHSFFFTWTDVVTNL
jgi:hypothetical protein